MRARRLVRIADSRLVVLSCTVESVTVIKMFESIGKLVCLPASGLTMLSACIKFSLVQVNFIIHNLDRLLFNIFYLIYLNGSSNKGVDSVDKLIFLFCFSARFVFLFVYMMRNVSVCPVYVFVGLFSLVCCLCVSVCFVNSVFCVLCAGYARCVQVIA